MKHAPYLLIIGILLLSACGKSEKNQLKYTAFDNLIDHNKPLAMGDDRDVHLFCDDANWQALKPFVQSGIEREVPIVYPEKYFNLIMARISDAEKLKNYKNLVFIGDLASTTPVSMYMKKVLDKEFITRVESSGGDLFVAKNLSSRDQIVFFLLGKDPLSLSKYGALQADNIFGLLLRRYAERQGYQAYQGRVIDPSFWDKYPFSLQIPDTYRLFSNDQAGRFLSFIYRAHQESREIPDKYISVYYEAMPENKVDIKWLQNKRRELGIKYFEGDEFDPDLIRSEPFRFGKYDGFRLLGAWKNTKHMIGGGFQSFAFWDKNTQTAYLIDNIVYFPAGDKLPILVELYAISNSLQVK